ncbi:hypothetical protein [Pseudomonas sp. BN102]|uniref:SMP-30/gluconolactonase/LRE family protein n=1 Tax=Pseudomonas sp. BN102 TaxID=2567886 RepID=UPI00245638AB|nr:hypothetical protein [Pseudomonas sp. BN102]MDH4611582.1 hypothetical protein [Pseudomonas sp. BN102]
MVLLLCLPACIVMAEPAQVDVQPFALLPEDVRYPEGLAVAPDSGEVFVGTFDARTPAEQRNNQVLRFSAEGALLARKAFGATPLTGLAVAGGQLYILNFGAGSLQRLPLDFDQESAVETLTTFPSLKPSAPDARAVNNPDGSQDRIEFGSSGMPAPNGMVFDRAGNLYVSDSFKGAILRVADATRCRPCKAEVLARDPLLATSGFLPFGANGLAFSADESLLYINNAGDGRVLRMRMRSGTPEVLAESLPGADGLMFHQGLLWVAANQVDQIVALNERGLPVAKIGAFFGLADDGTPRGLLFPASTAIQGGRMLVTNLALPLTEASGDEWEERVTRWSLVQFSLPANLPGENQ